jgi:transposase
LILNFAALPHEFFAELGEERAGRLETVSMDMGPAFAKSVTEHAPRATIAIDPFHPVKLVTDALDVVRRMVWNELRDLDADAAGKFKGARWALLKRPDNLTDEQATTLRKLRRRGGDPWRAHSPKESFRAIFAGDLNATAVTELLDRWISKAGRSRLPAFVKTAKTIRKFRDGILTAIRTGINNGRAEGLNCVVRLIIRRAEAALTPICSHVDQSTSNCPTNAPRFAQGDPHSCRESRNYSFPSPTP